MNSSTAELTAVLVKVNQETFNQAISLVSRAVAKHGIQPVLSNILLKADQENQTITLAATDLDLSLAIEIPAQVLTPGEITLPAQKTQELVSKLPRLELTLQCTDKEVITFACGRSKFEIKGLSADQFTREFLNIQSDNTEESFELPIKSLKEATHLVNFASDKKEANSILNGICLEISPKGLEIAATDGSRLAYYKIENATFTQEKKVVIPFRSINEFSRMISGLDEEFVKCYVPNSSQIVFKTASRTLSSSLIDGNYPKYQQLIPLNFSHTAIVERVNLLSALERVSVLANEKSKVVKLLFEESGVLNISAQTPDLGEAEDQLDMVNYEGQDFSIAFNVLYMAECLRNLDTKLVQIKMSEPLKPIVLSLQKDDNDNTEENAENKNNFEYLYLLMPVQLRN